MKLSKTQVTVISIAVAILIGFIGMFTYMHTYVEHWDEIIYPGVKVGSIDLSGKNKEEAKTLIKEKYENRISDKKLIVSAKGKEYNIEYKNLEAEYDIDDAVNKAFKYGKDDNIFSKYSEIKNKKGTVIKIKFSYNEEKINPVIQQIKKDVDKNPVNHTLKKSGEKFSIVDGSNGYKINEQKLKELIVANINGEIEIEEKKIDAPIEEIAPKNSKEELSKVTSKISSFTTTYKYNAARITNIKLSTEAINGTVLMPGEEFSFNNVVGERTAERGYKSAHVIVNDEFVDGLGGGICQTSSTLYSAMVRCKIDPTERYSHTIASSYVDIGQDATVSWGSPDYKFVNTLDCPIYIEGYASNSAVTFSVYASKELQRYTYKVYTGDKETISSTTSVVEDPNLPEGKQETVKSAHDGHKAIVYRETYDNGKFVKKEQLYKVNIKAVNGVVKKGTKKVVPSEETTVKDEKPKVEAPTKVETPSKPQ